MKRYVVMNGEGCVIEGIRPDGSGAMDFEPKHPLLFKSAEAAYRTADALHVMSGRIETYLVAERDDADVCTDSGNVTVDYTQHQSDYTPFHAVEVEIMCLHERRGGLGKRNPGNRPLGGPPTWRDGR